MLYLFIFHLRILRIIPGDCHQDGLLQFVNIQLEKKLFRTVGK